MSEDPVTDAALPLSIVIPVYNGESSIEPLVAAIRREPGGRDVQVVLVDDGSDDGTWEALKRLHAGAPRRTVCVGLSRNFGEHNAVMAGLRHAAGDHVVVMDDDFQNRPSDAFRLAGAAREHGWDIAFARYGRKVHAPLRNLGSRFANAVARFLLGLPPGTYLASFKCLSRFAVNEVCGYRGPFPYVDGLALRVTRRIGSVDCDHRPADRRSRYTTAKLVGLWLRMVLNFSVRPLRASTILGAAFSITGVVLSAFVVAEKLARPETPVGWPSLAVMVMMFGGIQLVVMGVVGEYLGHLFLTANGTPQYVVRTAIRASDERHGA